MSCVSQEVKDLYHLLEHEFLPLDFASRAQPLLAKISKLGAKLSSASSVPEVQLSQYIPALEKLTALRVLQQVSQVYQTMKTEMLSKMIPFLGFSVIEKLAVDAVKYDFISMKVNHVKGAVHFGNLDVESGGLRDHLAAIVESLNKARSMIYPSVKRQSKLGVNLVNLADNVEKEHRRLLARKSIIEKRKEEHERQMLELEHEEQTKRLKLQKLNEEAELQRLATEYSRREQERIRREIDEREHQEAQALLMETEKRGKKKGKRPAIEADKVTKQALLELALSEQLKEQQEMEKKLQRLAKTMDYMERAKREEEAPLIEAAYQQRLVEEQMLHEREQLQADELSRQHHTGDLQEKNRLSRMLENKLIFQNKIVGTREAEFKRLKEERDDRISQLRAERRHEREIKRKLLFYLKSEEERLNRLQEEEEARKREESERRKKEEAERKAKLDEIAERQRQRERELEERERLRREALLRPPEPTAKATEPAPAARPSQPVAAAAAAAPASAPTPGRYVPKFRRSAEGGQTAAPPPEPDRWSRQDDHPPLGGDRWRSSSDDRMSFAGGGSRLPSSSSSYWSSSRGRN